MRREKGGKREKEGWDEGKIMGRRETGKTKEKEKKKKTKSKKDNKTKC